VSTDRFLRPIAAASTLGDAAPHRLGFVDRRVLLTGEARILDGENGRLCFVNCLRLLVRMCGHVDISLPAGSLALRAESEAVAAHVSEPGQVRFVRDSLEHYAAILSVGVTSRPDLPWTVVNSNGWLARVSSGAKHLLDETETTNALGAYAAACFGVAEVFKRLIDLFPERGALQEHLTFSLDTYATGEVDKGPVLPEELNVDLLLVGAGAIGNGVALLLRQLPCRGHITVVDGQTCEPPNLGTCVLLGPTDLGRGKAEVIAHFLGSRLSADCFRGRLGDYAGRLGGEVRYPSVVLSALDSVSSRHEVQDLWPDLVIDGAIEEFITQVSRHPWREEIGCLRCLFRETPSAPAEKLQSAATGLSSQRISDPDSQITEEDVGIAPPSHRGWLRERIGRTVCSVVQEGVLREISARPSEVGPTVTTPFVAGLSAAMAVAELVKHSCGWKTTLAPRFQFDCLRGPHNGLYFEQARNPKCLCVERASNIEKWRIARSNRAAC